MAAEIVSLRDQLHAAVQSGLDDEARFHLQRQAVIDDLHAFNVRTQHPNSRLCDVLVCVGLVVFRALAS
jgi:hypothetical protein